MEKKKKVRIAFDVDINLYEAWIEEMFRQKLTNKSEFFRKMVAEGIKAQKGDV